MRLRIRSPFIYLISLIVLMGFNGCRGGGIKSEPYPQVDIPLYPKRTAVRQRFDDAAQAKTFIYRAQPDHSASEVLEFYDAQLNARGWQSSFEICQREWEYSSDGININAPFATQLFASWRHRKHPLTLDLWLTTERPGKHRPPEVTVKGLLQPIGDKICE